MFIKKIFSIFISIFLMVCLPISAYADTFSVQMVPTDGRHLDFVDDSNPNYEAIIINADVRGSGTYRGDFDMTGGIYTKQNWVVSDTPTFDINVWIESYGYPGCDDSDLYIGLEKKSAVTNKWSATDYAYVSAKDGGSVTLTGDGSGTYRIYLRLIEATGYRVTGTLNISYNF